LNIHLLLLHFILCLIKPVTGQQASIYPKSTWKTWSILKDESKPMEGILFEAWDMMLLFPNPTPNIAGGLSGKTAGRRP
jgi:hypothetical protein